MSPLVYPMPLEPSLKRQPNDPGHTGAKWKRGTRSRDTRRFGRAEEFGDDREHGW